MEGTKNSNVTKQLEKLLNPLKESSPAQYNIIQNLLDDVYSDLTINNPETLSKDIENKLYQLINDNVKFDL